MIAVLEVFWSAEVGIMAMILVFGLFRFFLHIFVLVIERVFGIVLHRMK